MRPHPTDAAPSRWLLVCAAPSEGLALLRAFGATEKPPEIAWKPVSLSPGFDLVVTGVGKANAAAGTARTFDPARHAAVMSIGVAGALPRSRLGPGDVVLASKSIYADEGIQTPQQFKTMAEAGFAPNQGVATGRMHVDASPDLLAILTPLATKVGPIATVSTCSGRNRLALKVVEHTGALAEAMEGASVGFTVERMAHEAGVPLRFAELRVISNTTGNRMKQVWDLAGALARLTEIVAQL